MHRDLLHSEEAHESFPLENSCQRKQKEEVLKGIVDLSRIYAAPITRLGCLAFEGQGAFASQS